MDELYDNILHMTNKQAASVLTNILKGYNLIARGDGKSILHLTQKMALSKAIDLLEATPDEKEE